MQINDKKKQKHFNKNLIMNVEDEGRFQSSNKYWICNKIFDAGDNQVRDHHHVTGKYRVSTYWSYFIDLKLAKKIL